MKTLRTFAALALFAAVGASAQSLGDLARQTRAQAQPAPVYTNANLPQAGDLSMIGAVPAAPSAPAAAPPAAPAALEKSWRDRFAAARAALDLARRQLDVTQRELNLAQVQYYSNPNVALRQETFRGQIDRLTAEVAGLRTDVTQREAALAALEDELRRAGLPPAWGRL